MQLPSQLRTGKHRCQGESDTRSELSDKSSSLSKPGKGLRACAHCSNTVEAPQEEQRDYNARAVQNLATEERSKLQEWGSSK